MTANIRRVQSALTACNRDVHFYETLLHHTAK